MRKSLLLWSKLSVIVLMLLTITSCSGDDKYYYEDNTVIATEFYKISQWTWNNDRGRYEATVKFPHLNKDIYDSGVLNASVFVKLSDNYEVQTPLPYIQTWTDNKGTPYTETLSFDISANNNEIAFYIQSTDLGRDDFYLPTYEIKVSFTYLLYK